MDTLQFEKVPILTLKQDGFNAEALAMALVWLVSCTVHVSPSWAGAFQDITTSTETFHSGGGGGGRGWRVRVGDGGGVCLSALCASLIAISPH